MRTLAGSASGEKREHLEEWFSIFSGVVGVSFVVKQRRSEEMKEVWEREETSVAGAEWVKRRLDVEASGHQLKACAQSELGGCGGWLLVRLCSPGKDVEGLTPGACEWNKIMPF